MSMPRRPAHPEIHLSLSTRLILLLLVAVVPAVSVEVYNDWRLRLERGDELRRTATAQAVAPSQS